MKSRVVDLSPGSLSLKQFGLLACMVVGILAAASSAQADANYVGVGTWHTPGNWTGASGATGLPASGDYIVITGGGSIIDMNADTWQHFVDNSLLTGGSSGEYRTQTIRLAQFGTATLNLDIGDGRIWRTTNSSLQYIGSQSNSVGTLNITSGDIRIETGSLRIAEKTGSTGLLNIAGSANTRLIVHRESGGVSMQVGTGGNGTFQISSGKFRTRAGVTVGSSGLFRVLGSSVTEVEVGDESSLDGNWTQNAGGILEFGIDVGGVTQINVVDKGGAGTYATFDDGSLLALDFLGAPMPGAWTLMQVENGLITDNGLALATGTGSGWSFDVDNSGANGLLTATYIPEPSTLALAGVGLAAFLSVRRKCRA